MHFEIAVVAVGLARQQAFELASCRLGAQLLQRRLGLGDDCRLAFGFAQLDQLAGFVDLTLDPLVVADRLVEFGTLAQQRLCGGRVIPQPRVLGLRVQLRKTTGCSLPVKDASSAAPTTC